MMERKNKIQRKFVPGSEWLYLKIYAGSKSVDKLLTEILPKLVSKFTRWQIVEKWFFIRYADPDFHLRVRFLLKDTDKVGLILKNVYVALSPYVESGVVNNILVDTYIREIERYHPHLMDVTESLFCVDSLGVLNMLKCLSEMKANDENRMLVSLKIIDMYLNNFGCDLMERQKLLSVMDDSFKKEFGFTPLNMKPLNGLYRKYTPKIRKVMESLSNVSNDSLNTVFEQYDRSVKKIAEELLSLSGREEQDDIIRSYIHMMMNRLFCSKNRRYELLVYNFLNRYYLSLLAQQKKKGEGI